MIAPKIPQGAEKNVENIEKEKFDSDAWKKYPLVFSGVWGYDISL